MVSSGTGAVAGSVVRQPAYPIPADLREKEIVEETHSIDLGTYFGCTSEEGRLRKLL